MTQTTTKRTVGRPREDHVLTEKGHCDVHGDIEFRLHLRGKRGDGTPRYSRRCPKCHAERNLEAYHARNFAR